MINIKDVHGKAFSTHFVMDHHGWCDWYFSPPLFEDFSISLSYLYDPFEDIVKWIDNVGNAQLTSPLMVNDEASIFEFTALSLKASNEIKLVIKNMYADHILLDIDVDRAVFSVALKREILRFFDNEFDPTHWDKFDLNLFEEEDLLELEKDGLKEWVFEYYQLPKPEPIRLLPKVKATWYVLMAESKALVSPQSRQKIDAHFINGNYDDALTALLEGLNRGKVIIDQTLLEKLTAFATLIQRTDLLETNRDD